MEPKRRSHMVSHWLRLIRWPNLLIAAFLMSVLRYGLIIPFHLPHALSDFAFFLFVMATLMIMAAGNIINDVYDLKSDAINKPNKMIINKFVKESSALKIYWLLNVLGLIIGIGLALYIGKIVYSTLWIISVLSLYYYSTDLKTKPLVGNLLIGFLGALLIINILMHDIIPVITEYKPELGKIIIYVFLFYAFFSFSSTLLREWIKTLQDVEGDKRAGYETLPIRIGEKNTKLLALILAILLLILLAVFAQLYTSKILKAYLILGPMLINAAIIYWIIKSDHYKLIQNLCKVYMLSGILAAPVFTIQLLGFKVFFS